jgi:hypothetical protein
MEGLFRFLIYALFAETAPASITKEAIRSR